MVRLQKGCVLNWGCERIKVSSWWVTLITCSSTACFEIFLRLGSIHGQKKILKNHLNENVIKLSMINWNMTNERPKRNGDRCLGMSLNGLISMAMISYSGLRHLGRKSYSSLGRARSWAGHPRDSFIVSNRVFKSESCVFGELCRAQRKQQRRMRRPQRTTKRSAQTTSSHQLWTSFKRN